MFAPFISFTLFLLSPCFIFLKKKIQQEANLILTLVWRQVLDAYLKSSPNANNALLHFSIFIHLHVIIQV